MIRPRMSSLDRSWRMEFAVEMNAMLTTPTAAITTISAARVGAAAAARMATPNAMAEPASSRPFGRARAATTSPPVTAPTPIRENSSP